MIFDANYILHKEARAYLPQYDAFYMAAKPERSLVMRVSTGTITPNKHHYKSKDHGKWTGLIKRAPWRNALYKRIIPFGMYSFQLIIETITFHINDTGFFHKILNFPPWSGSIELTQSLPNCMRGEYVRDHSVGRSPACLRQHQTCLTKRKRRRNCSMKRKFLSTLLALSMVLTLLPLTVFAADGDAHSITILQGGPYVQVNPTAAASGQTVTITVNVPEGKRFTGLTVDGSAEGLTQISDHTYTFTMPNHGVNVFAAFTDIYYDITISGSSQSLEVIPLRATKGEPIFLTAPDGTGFTEVKINGEPMRLEGGCPNQYVFTMPAADVIVSATIVPVYNIIYSEDMPEGVEISTDRAIEGESVIITINVPDGQVVDQVTVSGGAEAVKTAGKNNEYTFLMPAGDVEISVTFAAIFDITVEGEGVTVDKTAAREGASVTFTVSAPDGQVVDQVTVSGGAEAVKTAGKDNEYTFQMPAAAVTITATYKDSGSIGEIDPEKPDSPAPESPGEAGPEKPGVTGPEEPGGTDPDASDSPDYKVAVPASAANGTVRLSAATAKEGGTVTITAVPDACYKADTPVVKTVSGKSVAVTPGAGNTFIFTMPAEDVAVFVSFVFALKLTYTPNSKLSAADKALYYGGKLEVSGLVPGSKYVVTLDNGLALPSGGIPRSAFVITAGETGTAALSCQGGMNVIVFAVKGSNVTTDLEELYSNGSHAGVPVSTLLSGSGT